MPASPSTAFAEEAASKGEYDTTELARFRQEWLAELQRPKAELSGTTRTTTILAESTRQSQPPLSGNKVTKDPTVQISKENDSSLGATSSSKSRELIPNRRNLVTHPAVNKDGRMAPSFQTSKALESALNIYRRAVAHEQRSELDQALLLYRQAFQLVCGRVFAMVLNYA